MTEAGTRLLIPTRSAERWPWLDAMLASAAEKAGVTVDSGRIEGNFRRYDFGRRSAAELKPFIDYAVLRGGEGVWARVTGEHEITVLSAFVWIRPMGLNHPTIENPHPYSVAFRELGRLVAWDEGCRAWWATTGRSQFIFHQEHGDPSVPWPWQDDDDDLYVTAPLDLSILTVENPSLDQVEQQAVTNLRIIIERLAQQLGKPPPPLPPPLR